MLVRLKALLPASDDKHRLQLHVTRQSFQADEGTDEYKDNIAGSAADEHPTTLQDVEGCDHGYSSLEYKSGASLLPTTIEDDVQLPCASSQAFFTDDTCFWRYKPFLKGPKPVTFKLDMPQNINAHKPLTFTDPAVSWEDNGSQQIRVGKYRVGEGNDVTPNPGKLAHLGREVEVVQRKIAEADDILPIQKAKQMKRKLISRQCRLRRSANHEANKIIFAGLDKEREELSNIIQKLKSAMRSPRRNGTLTTLVENLKGTHTTTVAGRQADYVKDVLEQNIPNVISTSEDSAFDSDSTI